jgi:hypothetical protein
MIQNEDMDMSGGRMSKGEWIEVPLYHLPFKGMVSQHMRIPKRLLGLLW